LRRKTQSGAPAAFHPGKKAACHYYSTKKKEWGNRAEKGSPTPKSARKKAALHLFSESAMVSVSF
jgi:hypothetical protein